MLRILHLTLKRKWFIQIVNGTKKVEYREIKRYWETRLDNKEFDMVIFKNGYNKDCPKMLVECEKIEKKDKYYIYLGRIFEIHNYYNLK